jgi:hypothetical protein
MGGQILTLSTDGTCDFQTVGTPGVVSNIYTHNGYFASDRIVGFNGKTLTFGGAQAQGAGPLFQILSDIDQFASSAKTNTLYSANEVLIGSPSRLKIVAPSGGAGALGKVLMLVNATTGLTDYMPVPNLYTTNGTLTGNRTLSGGNFDLSFQQLNSVVLDSQTSTVNGRTKVNIVTPDVNNLVAGKVGQFLQLQDTGGKVEFAPMPGAANIYTTNGSLASHRIVDLANFELKFQGPGNVNMPNLGAFDVAAATRATVFAPDTTVQGSTKLWIKTPGFATAAQTQVLTLLADKSVEWAPAPGQGNTLYTGNGTLNSPREVIGGNNYLKFTSIGDFLVAATNAAITSTGPVVISGPTNSIGSSLAKSVTLEVAPTTGSMRVKTDNLGVVNQGDVLILADKPTGKVQYNSAVNITGPSTTVSGQSAVTVSSPLTTIGVGALTTGALKLKTPKVNLTTGKATAGQVLKLVDIGAGAIDGTVEFADDLVGGGGGGGGAGIFVGTGSAVVSPRGAGQYDITVSGISPTTFPVPHVRGMRVSTQVTSGITSNNVSPGTQRLRLTTSGTYFPILGPDGKDIAKDELVDRVTLDLVWVEGVGPSANVNGWLMVNTNWRSANHQAPVRALTGVTALAAGDLATNVYSGIGEAVPQGTAGRYDIYVKNTFPPYTGNSVTAYPAGMRVTIRLYCPTCPDTNSWVSIQAGQGIQIENGPYTSIYAGDGTQPAFGALFQGAVLDFMLIKNLQGEGGFQAGDVFVPANTTGQQLTSFAFPGITTYTTNRITTVGFVGVVDLPSALMDAPLTFKKISTLGNISVGDGFHADYYLTAYDPNVSVALFIRSSVDPSKMWKRLVAAQ